MKKTELNYISMILMGLLLAFGVATWIFIKPLIEIDLGNFIIMRNHDFKMLITHHIDNFFKMFCNFVGVGSFTTLRANLSRYIFDDNYCVS